MQVGRYYSLEELAAMLASVPGPITTWLSRWRSGEPDALEHIIPLVYDELRGVARRQLSREPIPNALSATTLVHETYLRLLQQRQVEAHDRSSFLAVAGCAMRRVLVDQARRRRSVKRGGRDQPISLEDESPSLLRDEDADQVLDVDAVLQRLEALDPRAARIVECRIFAGLTLEETAAALDVSAKTVQRTWTTARAWLRKELGT